MLYVPEPSQNLFLSHSSTFKFSFGRLSRHALSFVFFLFRLSMTFLPFSWRQLFQSNSCIFKFVWRIVSHNKKRYCTVQPSNNESRNRSSKRIFLMGKNLEFITIFNNESWPEKIGKSSFFYFYLLTIYNGIVKISVRFFWCLRKNWHSLQRK